MKTLVALVLAVIGPGAWAQSVELHVMQDGAQRTVNDGEVIAALTAFVESASVDSTSYVKPSEHWQEALAAPVFIHALFERPHPMKVRKDNGGDAVSLTPVREVVVVFPSGNWPTHVFVKTSDEIRSVTKYSPCATEKLILAARLDTQIDLNHLRSYCR